MFRIFFQWTIQILINKSKKWRKIAEFCTWQGRGLSDRGIPKFCGVSPTTVGNIKRIIIEPGTLARKAESGRPRKTTKQTNFINYFKKEIKKILPGEVHTLRRRKEQREFGRYFALRKPFLSERNRLKMLTFLLKMVKVLWSDESPFFYRFRGKASLETHWRIL